MLVLLIGQGELPFIQSNMASLFYYVTRKILFNSMQRYQEELMKKNFFSENPPNYFWPKNTRKLLPHNENENKKLGP